MHVTAQLKCGPVLHGEAFECLRTFVTFSQLRERLCRTNHACTGHCSDVDFIVSNLQCVGFVFVTMEFVVVSALDAFNERYVYGFAPIGNGATVRCEELFEQCALLGATRIIDSDASA